MLSSEIMANPQIQGSLERFIDSIHNEQEKSAAQATFASVLPLPGRMELPPKKGDGIGGFGDI